MSTADFMEWITVLLTAPIAALVVCFRALTALYVFFDVEKRSNNRVMSFALSVAVFLAYWPVSFFAYLICCAIIDRRHLGRPVETRIAK